MPVLLRCRTWPAAAVATALLVTAGCTVTIPGRGVASQGSQTEVESTEAAAPADPVDCSYDPVDPAVRPDLIDVGIPPDPELGSQPVLLETSSSRGDFEMTLDPETAPCATNSMAFLVQEGFFDGSPCHRLVNAVNFGVLQCGDPTGTGAGGPAYGYSAEPDSLVALEPAGDGIGLIYPRGSVAMASGGSPLTIGSQFFICFEDTQLAPDYTLVGTITSGIEVIDVVATGGNDESLEPAPGGGAPLVPITLQRVTVQS